MAVSASVQAQLTASDDVLALGLQREEGVEGDDTVDIRHGNAGLLKDDLLDLQRDVAVLILDVAENHHKGCFFICVPVADLHDLPDAVFTDVSHNVPPDQSVVFIHLSCESFFLHKKPS